MGVCNCREHLERITELETENAKWELRHQLLSEVTNKITKEAIKQATELDRLSIKVAALEKRPPVYVSKPKIGPLKTPAEITWRRGIMDDDV